MKKDLKTFIVHIFSFALLILLIVSFIAPFFLNLKDREYSMDLPYYFLVLGRDEDLDNTVRTDVIILAGLNKGKILLLSIPRDLMVNLDGKDRKINSVYELYGIEALKAEIEKLTKTSIQDYIIFDYSIFKEIGNLLGPIDIYLEKDMRYQDYHQNLYIDFKKGNNQLTGEELLAYVRYRDDSGDLGRIDRQKKAIFALMDEAKKASIAKLYEAAELVLNNTINTFELNKLLFLYTQGKDATLDFLQFPYKIVDNYVIVDNSQISDLQYKLSTFETDKIVQDSKIWILFTKNFKNTAYNFYTFVFSTWTSSGYQIKVLDEKFDLLSSDHSYVFFKDIDENKKEKVMKDLEKTYKTNFIEVTDKIKYFELIKFISDNLINTLDYDVLVVLNDRW